MAKVALISRCAWTLYNFRRNLALAVQDAGHKVVLIGAPRGDYPQKLLDMGLDYLPVHLQDRSLNPLDNARTVFELRAHFGRIQPDIVHNFTIKPVILSGLALRLSQNNPVLINTITGLGHAFSDSASGPLRWVISKLYASTLPRSHHIFFQNENDQKVLNQEAWFEGLPSSRVPGSGVDTRHFDQDRYPSLPANAPLTFIMVTRLLKEKGVLEYCGAARRLKLRYPDTRFMLVGSEDTQSASAISQEDLNDYLQSGVIELFTNVDNVSDYLAQAHVSVLPTYYNEGTPRSLLEAASMGKAIITTDRPGCRDTLIPDRSGLLVKERDDLALCDAFEFFAEDTSRAITMGKLSRNHARGSFDEHRIFSETLNVYEQQLEKRLDP